MTEHDRQVLRSIYGRGLLFSVQPSTAQDSLQVLLSQGLIEPGTDPDEKAGSLVYRVTNWGRTVLGVTDDTIQ